MKSIKTLVIIIVICLASLVVALETISRDISSNDNSLAADTSHIDIEYQVTDWDSIHYVADSIFYDVDNETIYLFSNANLKYHNSSIKADEIVINLADNKAHTKGDTWMQDGTQVLFGKSASYHFQTGQGIIYAGASQLEKGFYYGGEIRKVAEDVYDIDKGYFTTCDLEEPNFYIYSGKMRLFYRDKIVARPIIFYVNHFPILMLPFGTFSVKTERASGILVPEPGYNTVDGKYLENIALYYAYNDYAEILTAMDWRELTGWEARIESNYIKRYYFSGNLLARFQNRIMGQGNTRQEWYIRGRHRHDFIDRSSLDANLEFMSSRTIWESSSNVDERLSERVTSTIAYRKPFQSTTLNLGATYTDNLSDDTKQIILPTFSYSLPSKPLHELFRAKQVGIADRWWQNFYYSYSVRGVHYGNITKPSPSLAEILFKNRRDDQDKYLAQHNAGVRHSVSLSFNRTIAGWLNFSQSLSGNEVWFDRDTEDNSLVRGFDYSTNTRLSHSIYGIANFPDFPVSSFRHIMTPTFSFNYSPDFTDRQGKYYSFGGINLSSATKRRNISFSLNHKWSLKYYQRATNTHRPLNDFLTLNSSIDYDLEQDVKPFSDINHSATFQPGIINLGLITLNYSSNFSARQDAYDFDVKNWRLSNGIRINGQARYRNYFPQQKNVFFTGSAFQSPQPPVPQEVIDPFFDDTQESPQIDGVFENMSAQDIIQRELRTIPNDTAQLTADFNQLTEILPWNITINHDYSRVVRPKSETQNIRSALSFRLTRNWAINYSNYYNIEKSELISQSLSVDRDLLCWKLTFTWSKQGDYWNYRLLFYNIQLPDALRIRRSDYKRR